MDNDRDMRVSIEELKAVLSISSQGRTKMNSTLFRNLVEKSEKVKFEGMNSNFKFDPTLRVIPSRSFLTNFCWLMARASITFSKETDGFVQFGLELIDVFESVGNIRAFMQVGRRKHSCKSVSTSSEH